MEWSSSLSVNVAEIDSQHQRLIHLINDLDAAMRVGKGKDILGKIISQLANYTVAHFSTEETYFDKFGYPEAPTHKAEHKKFVEEVSKFKKDFDDGRVGLSTTIMNFLTDWLKSHIMGKDKKYGPFFNGKGLK